MLTLGIETSCDETALAVYDPEHGIIAEAIYSQIDLHAIYGGVVPELASRDHCQKILPLLENNILNTVDIKDIELIAYTAGPGLGGALLIGESFAQGLAIALNLPLIGVNHLEGHLQAPFLNQNEVRHPLLTLLVSGGHSMIIDVADFGQYSILGESRDDAVGEAFDKVAKLLDLRYPGGPEIERLAESGELGVFNFPIPLADKDTFDMSFSGLKTSVLYALQDIKTPSDQDKANIAIAFQEAATSALAKKVHKALTYTKRPLLVCTGGVAANKVLRSKLTEIAKNCAAEILFPELKHCTDNAAMIAYVGYLRRKEASRSFQSIVKSRWPLKTLSSIHG
ncbi:MAG: tRNA (adenosine(37)-N6)-threonylcarbamoyltransferase complex transferase subunit TsaD [Gammaproteobacteria bacterium]